MFAKKVPRKEKKNVKENDFLKKYIIKNLRIFKLFNFYIKELNQVK